MNYLSSNKIISLNDWLDKKKTAEINQLKSLDNKNTYQHEQETADSIEDDLILSGVLIW